MPVGRQLEGAVVKWEYKMVEIVTSSESVADFLKTLNESGNDEWELVGIVWQPQTPPDPRRLSKNSSFLAVSPC
jgi:hypothetical protein